MSVFIAVANAGSLSAAARSLGEPLTNVSRLLAQIEEHLGVTLVERTTRRLALTAAGRDYLGTCRRILEDLNTAEALLAGQSSALSGGLSVTAPVGLGRRHVLPVVTDFLAAYPEINVRLVLLDRIVDLMGEDVDVAIRVGKMKDSQLLASGVGTLKLVTCAAPAYLARRGAPHTVDAIAGHDCITFGGLSGGTRWVFTSRRYGRQAIRVRSRLDVNAADAAVAAAVEGVGIARVLSYQAEDALRSRALVPVLQRFDDGAIPVSLVHRPARASTSIVREFVRFASAKLRARLEGG
ncbi:MAG: LysR family transcriptional regulator [Hyphomicrobium sp.]|nr:LysR family transcriptional regulator [Hyphomicrobium sp.]